MSSGFLIYSSTGFVGDAIARLAMQRGLRPVIAGRNVARVEAQVAWPGMPRAYKGHGLDAPRHRLGNTDCPGPALPASGTDRSPSRG
ncbi:MAG: hypothetical protein H6Q38_2223 [Chloroflexi bacterium]|nr:hypothetical protein [Chloroflexota bacterium]